MHLGAVVSRCLTAACAVIVAGLSLEAAASDLSAGAGKADIVIKSGQFPVEEFSIQHDPLAVKAILLDDGNTRIGILVVDQTSMTDARVAELKSVLRTVAGVSAQNAIVCASHTFSAPHVFLRPDMSGVERQSAQDYVEDIRVAAEQAVKTAVDTLSPARIAVGQGSSRVGVNREVQTAGGWWLGANEAGYSDPQVGVVRIDGVDGMPKAVLMNVAVQPAVLDASQLAAGGRAVSADLAGAATRYVETHYGAGVVAAYLVGAAGDQVPYFQARRYVMSGAGSLASDDLHEAAFPLLDLFGERLGGEVVRAADLLTPQSHPTLQVVRQTVDVPAQAGARGLPGGPVKTYTYVPDGMARVPVVLMRIGDTVFVGLQAELSAELGAEIRKNSPFSHTLVLTLVDGAAKYMPEASAYPRFTYTARNSRYAQGAGEITVGAIGRMLADLKSGQ